MKQFFNIVLPMAGKGSRFRKNGYKESKPFIDINGRYMIVILNLLLYVKKVTLINMILVLSIS
jgi:CTP:phosphocholine cytidylyltransferase-like protein